MLTPFTELRDMTIRTESGELELVDMLFDPATADVPFVLARQTGWFGSDMMVRTSDMGLVNVKDGVWDAATAEVKPVPVSDNVSSLMPDIRTLPTLVTGPFGNTQSPAMVATQAADVLSGPSKTKLPDHLGPLSDWLGAVVFGPAGPMGRIVNMHIEAAEARVRDVSIAVDSKTHQLPISALRSLFKADCYAVTDLTEEDLAQGFTAIEEGPKLPRPPKHGWVGAAA